MSSLRSLYKSTLHYVAGNLGVLILGFISFPLTTRSLSVAQYGDLNVAMRVALLVVIVAKIGLPHSMLRFHAEDAESPDEHTRDKYYSTFILTACAAAAAASVLYALFLTTLPDNVVGPSLRALLLLSVPFVFANALNSLLTGFLSAGGKSREFAAVQFLTKLLSVVLMIGFLYLWELSARALLTSNVLSELATFAVLVFMIARKGFIRRNAFDLEYAKKAIAFAAPLVIYEMSSAVLDGGDRLIIKSMLGSAAVGLYSAAYNISGYLQDLIFMSVHQALVPMWLRIWNTEGKEATSTFLSRSLNDFILICCLVCCGTFVCAGDALVVLAGPRYLPARPLVPLIVLGLVIYTFTSFFNAGLYLNKRTGVMATVVLISAVLNLALNYYFLPIFGIIAAVWATIVSYTFVMMCMAIASRRYLVIRIDWPSALKGVVTAAVVAFALSFIEFDRAILNVLIKGTLAVIGFVLLMGATHTPLRQRFLPGP
jgi:O-antigen/teichoic acid export membrane protein